LIGIKLVLEEIVQKTFYKQRRYIEKYIREYRIENADLSNEITVKSVKLVQGF